MSSSTFHDLNADGRPITPRGSSSPTPETCPMCGAERTVDAVFCEGCGHDFLGGAQPLTGLTPPTATETQTRHAPVRAKTAEAGEESPLDVGWTGPVGRGVALDVDPTSTVCGNCNEGHFLDGYCDLCGAKQPDPRDHFVETPSQWLAGVCDIGKRKHRNEDAMALLASTAPLQQGVIVVCDGVSNSSDSHIASLAAARAARDVLDDPVPHAMGQENAVIAAIQQRLAQAVEAAKTAVIETTADTAGDSPPSCTFVGALIDDGLAVVGNVGDSRAYWLPDAPSGQARLLSVDDSFAAERIRTGVPRDEAEAGVHAHAITQWLGADSPPDTAPHTAYLPLADNGWLLLCSDGLWNYCSEPEELRTLVARGVNEITDPDSSDPGSTVVTPETLARWLVDYANTQGGIDNITVALARVEASGPAESTGKDSADGDVHV